jgi:dGTP triphosphohydrolase
MAGNYEGELLYDVKCGVRGLYETLKQEIGFKNVYCSKETLRLELLGRNVIHYLMDTFWQADPSAKSKTFARKAVSQTVMPGRSARTELISESK